MRMSRTSEKRTVDDVESMLLWGACVSGMLLGWREGDELTLLPEALWFPVLCPIQHDDGVLSTLLCVEPSTRAIWGTAVHASYPLITTTVFSRHQW